MCHTEIHFSSAQKRPGLSHLRPLLLLQWPYILLLPGSLLVPSLLSLQKPYLSNLLQPMILLTASWNCPVPWPPTKHSPLVLFQSAGLCLLRIVCGLLLCPASDVPVPQDTNLGSLPSATDLAPSGKCFLHGHELQPCLQASCHLSHPCCTLDLRGSASMFIWMPDSHPSPNMSRTLSPWPPEWAFPLEFPISVMSVPIHSVPQAKRAPSSPPSPSSQFPICHQLLFYFLNFPKLHLPLLCSHT